MSTQSENDERRTSTERRILRQLSKRGPLDAVELAANLDDHPMTVEVACERLHEKDRVRLIGSGRYRVAADESAH